MLKLNSSARFRKDFRICEKRGYDMRLLSAAVDMLKAAEPLPSQCREHALAGNWKGFMECHLAPDWLLIYRISGDKLYLTRTGTHSDVFRG